MTNKPERAKQDKSSLPEKMTPAEAARELYVSTRTLTRMGERGKLTVIRLPSGHRRYLRDEVVALATTGQDAA